MLQNGLDIPRVKIRTGLSEQSANDIEIALIAAIGRYPDGSLVNLTDGGDGRIGAKLSDAHKAVFRRYGPHSEKTKRLMSQSATNRAVHPHGWKWTDKQRETIPSSQKNNKHCLGRKHSDKTRQKLSQKAKARGVPLATMEAAWRTTRGKKWTKEKLERRSASYSQNRLVKKLGGISCGFLSQGS
jgi:hypothetical protein